MSLKFDLESIPEGEGLQLDLVEKRAHFNIDQPDCSLARDVSLRGRLTRLGAEGFFKGRACTALNLTCSRCLEPFQFEVNTGVSACFLPRPSRSRISEEHELHDSDIEVEYYDENRLDLTQPVYDQVLLTLPFIPLCRKDCKGLCPQCGVNWNIESCNCGDTEAVDPRMEVLRQLKDKLK